MRKKNYEISGNRLMRALSYGDEPLLKEEELPARSGVSPKNSAWPLPAGDQVTAPALSPGPTKPRGKPKETSPPRQNGPVRHRDCEVTWEHQKPTLSSGDETFLTEQQLAARWQVSPKTLRNARVEWPPVRFVKIGRSVRYRLSEVIAYEEEHSVRSTSGGEE